MKLLVVMPEFAGHEKDMIESEKFRVELISYDEKKLVRRKWYMALFLPGICLFSSIGLINYQKIMFYMKDYKILNAFLKEKLLSKSRLRYEKVLWIKAVGVEKAVIKLDGVTNIDRVLYFYDPVDRYPSVKNIFNLFYKVFTFDSNDSERYGLAFLPMFHGKKNFGAPNHLKKKLFDLVYVGSFTPQRLVSCCILKLFLPRRSCKFILVNRFLPSFRLFGVELTNKSKDRSELIGLYQSTKCILELLNLDQVGASQRKTDSEMLGLPYLSLPCISVMNFVSYLRMDSYVLQKSRESLSSSNSLIDAQINKNDLSVDFFLSRVTGVEG